MSQSGAHETGLLQHFADPATRRLHKDAMQQLFRNRSPRELLRRLDRGAEAMNPFLTLLLIGLAILNVT